MYEPIFFRKNKKIDKKFNSMKIYPNFKIKGAKKL